MHTIQSQKASYLHIHASLFFMNTYTCMASSRKRRLSTGDLHTHTHTHTHTHAYIHTQTPNHTLCCWYIREHVYNPGANAGHQDRCPQSHRQQDLGTACGCELILLFCCMYVCIFDNMEQDAQSIMCICMHQHIQVRANVSSCLYFIHACICVVDTFEQDAHSICVYVYISMFKHKLLQSCFCICSSDLRVWYYYP